MKMMTMTMTMIEKMMAHPTFNVWRKQPSPEVFTIIFPGAGRT